MSLMSRLTEHPLLKANPHRIPDSVRDGAAPMIAVIATARAKPGRGEDLKQVLALFASLVRANEPGLIHYEVAQSRENPDTFKVFEVYRDQEALEFHMYHTPYVGELRTLMLNLLEGEPDLEWLDSILD